jgi:ELP3 family radical SAM enzyme/protein acetyltransferase
MTHDIEDTCSNKYKLDHLQATNIKLGLCMQYKPVLLEILDKIKNENITDKKIYDKMFVNVKKKHGMTGAKKAKLSVLYKHFVKNNVIDVNKTFEEFNTVREVRGNSGVLVIAVMLSNKPFGQDFTCKWDCHYCPKQPGQPRSYIDNEPAVSRGNRYNFDPHLQFTERASTHFINGHTVDKIELLLLGGTFHSYPKDYRAWFIKMLIYSANTFYDSNKRDPLSFEEEVEINETSLVRIIGITIETRPDCINPETLLELRQLEVTRIQMGVQHTDDDVLSKNNRGHKFKHAVRGVKMAMDAGFKVDIHLMTNLPGSSAEKDRKMFETVLSNPYVQGDQWKIYPTQVTPWTKIAKWFKDGYYDPYDADEMFEVILDAKTKIPPWLRNNRIIRDFSSKDDLARNIVPNMRQDLHTELTKRGLRCHCIRCLEVRNDVSDIHRARLTTRYIQHEIDKKYGTNHVQTSDIKDYFLSFESCSCDPCEKYYWHLIRGSTPWTGCPNRNKLYGFLRLRICNVYNKKFPELHRLKVAYVRELHVYGKITAVGDNSINAVQHYSFGKRLLMEAEKIARQKDCDKIAIISGLGVRKYYEKFDYVKSYHGKYMMKDVPPKLIEVGKIYSYFMVCIIAILSFLYFKYI